MQNTGSCMQTRAPYELATGFRCEDGSGSDPLMDRAGAGKCTH